jgi:hypothetical protein
MDGTTRPRFGHGRVGVSVEGMEVDRLSRAAGRAAYPQVPVAGRLRVADRRGEQRRGTKGSALWTTGILSQILSHV